MSFFTQTPLTLLKGLDWLGAFLPQLPLRFILAYEFWKAGTEKFNGQNWFTHIKDQFPFPFNQVPVEISWQLATWTEMLGAAAMLIGLGTRFFSASLVILTVVAILSAHMPHPAAWNSLLELWKAAYHHNPMPNGNYGFELPLLYLIMLLPLLFSGPGKASVDYLIYRSLKNRPTKGSTPD